MEVGALLTSVGFCLPRIDLAVLLGKTPSSMENESTNLESSQTPSLAQPLVFSNSKQSALSQPASGNSFSHHSMVRKCWSLPVGVCLRLFLSPVVVSVWVI